MATRNRTSNKNADIQRHGLRTFAMHLFDPSSARFIKTLRKEAAQDANFAAPANSASGLDPETVAIRYLQKALGSRDVPDLTPGDAEGVEGEFSRLGTETVLLTRSNVVKFRQMFNKIPVYGSLVAVELDERNRLLSLSSLLGDPKHVKPIASISPARALKSIRRYPGYEKHLDRAIPQLYYYFDSQNRGKPKQWRLVYITEDVPVTPRTRKKKPGAVPLLMDYFVDAHRGSVVAELPRTPTIRSTKETTLDGKNRKRRIRVDANRREKVLRDEIWNVQTFDFQFKDPKNQTDLLPGKPINSPPHPFPPGAVSAQANAVAVATFLREVLRRHSIDNHGAALHASVNCVVRNPGDPPTKEWVNALWLGGQLVFGQKQDGRDLVSLAVDLDVVGHETFHGVTASTARLEYRDESGALNESYSDIFGVMINNSHEPDVRKWNWRVGDGFGAGRKPLRDMQRPSREGQPEHMDQYRRLPYSNDSGGVHINSGIHNHAAYFILAATDHAGRPLLTPREVAAVFYIALSQHLSRRSLFRDSRRAALLAARTLFRTQPRSKRTAKVNAIARAFDRVGITE